MPTLHLGVIDLPYVAAPTKRQKKPRAGTVTTGDVAEWLENRYAIMQTFVDQHGQEVADDLALSVKNALESVLAGAPTNIDPIGSGASEIEDRFKQFLAQGEMEKLGVPGVPTQAALERKAGKRSGRMKRSRRKKGATGVSFIDTGLYQSSFKAWVD